MALSPPAQDPANRKADVASVEPGGRHLVEQWLKRVEVVGIDDGDVDIRATQTLDDPQPAEPGTDHDDMRATHRVRAIAHGS